MATVTSIPIRARDQLQCQNLKYGSTVAVGIICGGRLGPEEGGYAGRCSCCFKHVPQQANTAQASKPRV